MNFFKSTFFTVFLLCIFENVHSQNVLINVLTQNNGLVKRGEVVFFEVNITNTNSTNHVGIYKIKAQVSVPSELVNIDTSGHILPTGWKIISNTGSTITLSNGKDMIAASDSRSILIALRGKKIGGPSTLSGQLSFSDGIEPGTAIGSITGDLTADNFSTSTIKVVK